MSDDDTPAPRTTGAAITDAVSGAASTVAAKPHLVFWWLAGLTLFWHWLGYDLSTVVFAWYGKTPPAAPQQLYYTDVLALIGLPASAHFSFNRNQGTTE